MFFPNPLQGLVEMRNALRPGGSVCTMVFGAPERNPCITILMSTAMKHAGLAPRDPFQPGGLLSLGQPGLVDRLSKQAGFNEVATTVIDAPFRMPSARRYLDFIRSSASPLLQILGRLEAGRRRGCLGRDRTIGFPRVQHRNRLGGSQRAAVLTAGRRWSAAAIATPKIPLPSSGGYGIRQANRPPPTPQ